MFENGNGHDSKRLARFEGGKSFGGWLTTVLIGRNSREDAQGISDENLFKKSNVAIQN
jgi:hypothetical protein